MNGDGLVFVCVVLAAILLIGIIWQAFNAHLDYRSERDAARRRAVRAARYRDIDRNEP